MAEKYEPRGKFTNVAEGADIVDISKKYGKIKDRRGLLSSDDILWLRLNDIEYYIEDFGDRWEYYLDEPKEFFENVVLYLDIKGLQVILKCFNHQLMCTPNSYVRLTAGYSSVSGWGWCDSCDTVAAPMVKMLLHNYIIDGDTIRMTKDCPNKEISEYIQKFMREKMEYTGNFSIW